MGSIMAIRAEIQTVVGGFIKNGPRCYCGNRDWFVGESGARYALIVTGGEDEEDRETSPNSGYTATLRSNSAKSNFI